MARTTRTDRASSNEIMRRRGYRDGGITERKNRQGVVIAYQAQVRTPAGRRSQTFKTEAQARVWLRQATYEAAHGQLSPKQAPTFATFLTDEWLPAVKDQVKPRTYSTYALNVRRVPTWLGSIRLDDLKPAHIQRLSTELRSSKRLSAQTVHQVHQTMHRALRDALTLGWITRNPADGVQLPRIPTKRHQWYADDQLARLFAATEGDRDHALWVVLGTSGLRLAEALGLTWHDVDWDAGTLRVARTVQRYRKDAGGGRHVTDTKTEGSQRTLRLSQGTLDALKAHQDRQEFEKRREGWLDHDLIFPSTVGTIREQRRVHDAWARACALAGIPRYRIHDLRHSVASSLIASRDMTPFEVAAFLGHTTAQQVIRTYGHVAPGTHDKAASHMQALFASAVAAE